MKKSITVLFVLALAVCGATGASAQSESDFKVTTADGKVTITGYTGYATAVVIPATIGGKPVVAIGYKAFTSGYTSITIPASVTSIGNYAFFDGYGRNTDGPERWVTSGPAAIIVDTQNPSYSSRDGVLFSKTGDTLIRCPIGKKGEYAIPAGVTNIGVDSHLTDGAFEGCTGLTSVSMPASVTSIGDSAFKNCTRLISISIPASVTSIGDSVFNGCWQLTAIQVNANNNHYTTRNGVLFNKAENTLIAYTVGLNEQQYAIPNSVTRIGDDAFKNCFRLTSISIPASVTSIGSSAFFDCTGLTSVNIPASVTRIEWSAFADCTGLTSVNIPKGVTTIEARAFYGCTGLTSVTIPAGVTRIEGSTFDRCMSLTSVTIPAGVTSIGNGAFFLCGSLTSVSIPVSVTSIGSAAFGMTGLTSIRIGANVEMEVLIDRGVVLDEPFNNDFHGYYGTNGKKAGLYTYRNGAWSYAAQ